MASYAPLSDYAIIGNTRTAALIGRDGSVDWLCVPRFDSPSVFGALLDRNQGGTFKITAARSGPGDQQYIAGTNVLVTRFEVPEGVLEVTDWMPCWEEHGTIAAAPTLQRLVACKRGRCDVVVEFAPRLNYGRHRGRWDGDGHQVTISRRGRVILRLDVRAPRPLTVVQGRASGQFSLSSREKAVLTLSWNGARSAPVPEDGLSRTIDFWRAWLDRLSYNGPYRNHVSRSALVLKLLTYSPTGAIVAAPTTSLPEAVGGARNWDYRYTWLRDATLTLDALFALGFEREAKQFAEWIAAIARREPRGAIRIMYRVDGSSGLRERTLNHLEGYRGSRPVRVGNAAAGQRQLDVLGEALNCLYFCGIHRHVGDRGGWEAFANLADRVARDWSLPDSGIWEMRSTTRHFVHSKAMCWVALERAYQIACDLGLSERCDHWRTAAEEIRSNVLRHGFDSAVGSFVQAFGHRIPDASLLLLPLAGFIDANDQRMVGTVAWLKESLSAGDALLYRYLGTDDGTDGSQEGAFVACAFWLVSCLARMGRAAEASAIFERLLSYASPLGLYSEEIDPETHSLVGNYPQALTHIALINAALDLGRTPEGSAGVMPRRTSLR